MAAPFRQVAGRCVECGMKGEPHSSHVQCIAALRAQLGAAELRILSYQQRLNAEERKNVSLDNR